MKKIYILMSIFMIQSCSNGLLQNIGLPSVQENSEFEIKANLVIKALGFDPEDLPKLFSEEKLQVSRWGTIKADFETMETNIDGVFAAGDIVRGASLVVWAIKDGRDAATSIDSYLLNKQKLKVAS